MIAGRLYLSAGFIGAAFLLQGCSAVMMGANAVKEVSTEYFLGEQVNLNEKSYAAADYIVGQARTYIYDYDLIKVEPLVSLDTPDLTSDFAHIVPEQMGARFVQLGYRMDLSAVVPAMDQSFADSPDTKGKPDLYLRGTYKVAELGMQVSVRLVKDTGRVVGAFTYHLPYDRDVKHLAAPKPQIFIPE